MNNPQDDQKRLRQVGVYATIPFVLAAPPVVGWLIGSWLDKLLKTGPFLMYLLVLLGFVAGFREVFRLIKRFGQNGS